MWWGIGLSCLLFVLREILTTVLGWLWLLIHGSGGADTCASGYSLSLGTSGHPECQPSIVTSLLSSFFWAVCMFATAAACLFFSTTSTSAGTFQTPNAHGGTDGNLQDSSAQLLRCISTAAVTRSRDLPVAGGRDSSALAETVGNVFPGEVAWAREVSPCATSGRLRALINYPSVSDEDSTISLSGSQYRRRGTASPWGWVSLVSAQGERLFQVHHPQDVTVAFNGRLSPSRARTVVDVPGSEGETRVIEGSLAVGERVARIDPEYEALCITVGTVYDPLSPSLNRARFQPLSLGATPVAFGPGTDAWLRLPLPLPLVLTDPLDADLSHLETPLLHDSRVLHNHDEVRCTPQFCLSRSFQHTKLTSPGGAGTRVCGSCAPPLEKQPTQLRPRRADLPAQWGARCHYHQLIGAAAACDCSRPAP